MAESTFYERRMQELQGQQQEHAANVTGSPLLQRPQSGGNVMAQTPDGNPNTQPDPSQEQLKQFQDSHFGQLHAKFVNDDPHYGVITQNLTDLAMALKKQVDQGYMPMAIAQERIHQFVQDHRAGYAKGNHDKFAQGMVEGSQAAQGAMQEQMQKAQQQAQNQLPDAQVTKIDHPDDKENVAGDEQQPPLQTAETGY